MLYRVTIQTVPIFLSSARDSCGKRLSELSLLTVDPQKEAAGVSMDSHLNIQPFLPTSLISVLIAGSWEGDKEFYMCSHG